jgi:hypothetical protein
MWYIGLEIDVMKRMAFQSKGKSCLNIWRSNVKSRLVTQQNFGEEDLKAKGWNTWDKL